MSRDPLILAIDAALGSCSVVLWQDGKILAHEREEAPGRQSRVLIPLIEAALAQSAASYAQCDAIAASIGPGGFTGVRAGLAAARAIALVAGKPLLGIGTLAAMVFVDERRGDLLAALDAHRGEWYAQRFRRTDRLTPLTEPLLVRESALEALAHGAARITSAPDAAAIAALAEDEWNRGERDFPSAPLYLRPPDAKPQAKENLNSGSDSL